VIPHRPNRQPKMLQRVLHRPSVAGNVAKRKAANHDRPATSGSAHHWTRTNNPLIKSLAGTLRSPCAARGKCLVFRGLSHLDRRRKSPHIADVWSVYGVLGASSLGPVDVLHPPSPPWDDVHSVTNGPVSSLPGRYPGLQSCRCHLFITSLERDGEGLVQGALDRRDSRLLDLAQVTCPCVAGNGGLATQERVN
jgi:hypothetical protein